MKKHTTHLILIAVLAVSTFTFSFAHWRAQAAGGSGIWAGLSAGLPGRKAERAERHVAAAVAPVKVTPAAPMFATITVNSTADDTLAALAGNGTCDLREAITAANTNAAVDVCAAGTAGADTIEFNLGAGTPTINVMSALPDITDPVTINGNTGGSTRVELNGAGAGANVNGLMIRAGNSTITGLVINRFNSNTNSEFGNGIWIRANGGNTIINCYIGTDATGTIALGNTFDGLRLNMAPNNTIGGITAGERNVISGNGRVGIYIINNVGAAAIGNRVIGNYIGRNATDTADLGNGLSGVSIEAAANNTIGGTSAAERNVISGNNDTGVTIFGGATTSGNVILGNSIFNNTKPGIDVALPSGVNPNDTGDGDTGANGLQNFPVLTCSTNVGGVTTIGGTLNSLAMTEFRIEYFVNDACDASGNGEGQTLLSTQNVTTDASGNAALTLTVPTIAVGKFITSTATRLDAGNPVETSEFSQCLAITAPPTLAINDVTLVEGNAGTTNFVFTVTLSGAQNWCSPVTVNYATANGTALSGSDYTATSGTLTFSPPHASNSVTQTITIPVTGETVVELNETFFVNLSGATNNATIADNQGLGTITNDDNPAAAPLTVRVADPAVCLDPNGLVGVQVTVTNPNNTAQISSWNVTLPVGLTAVAGSCAADVNPGGCVVAANGGSLAWNGTLAANQTVNIIYRARIGANAGPGAQLCLDNQATVGGVPFNVNYCFNVVCPNIVNTRVSDQKAGSVLVFPYYTSTVGGGSDTRMTITNTSNDASTLANQTYVHLFFIDGTTCQQADLFLCLTPNASFSFKASEYDPGNTGYVLAVAVNREGVPVQNNVLIGNAFVNTPQFLDNYSAESFWANSFAVATVEGNRATLYFDQVGYDAVPKQFAVEIQSPVDAVGQQVITAGLSGDLTTSAMSGAAQVGTGQAFNEKEVFTSFNGWLTGTCQARGTIATNSPRVANGLGNLIKTGQAGSLKFNVGGAVGLLLTPRTATWKGIRTLHKTQTTVTTITIPIMPPVC